MNSIYPLTLLGLWWGVLVKHNAVDLKLITVNIIDFGTCFSLNNRKGFYPNPNFKIRMHKHDNQ